MENWTKDRIDGVFIRRLVKYVDERGYLTETFRVDEMPGDLKPAMSYISYTEPDVARGPHEHEGQTDIFAFVGPANFLIRLWDNRPDSRTYGNIMEFYGGEDNPVVVVVPPGVVHGYKNVSRTKVGMVLNYPDRLFMGWGKREPIDEIRHEGNPGSLFKMEG